MTEKTTSTKQKLNTSSLPGLSSTFSHVPPQLPSALLSLLRQVGKDSLAELFSYTVHENISSFLDQERRTQNSSVESRKLLLLRSTNFRGPSMKQLRASTTANRFTVTTSKLQTADLLTTPNADTRT